MEFKSWNNQEKFSHQVDFQVKFFQAQQPHGSDDELTKHDIKMDIQGTMDVSIYVAGTHVDEGIVVQVNYTHDIVRTAYGT